MPGPFKKIKKKILQNKIKKLNKKIEDLQGDGYGVFQPAWDEGGEEVIKYTKKIFNLKDRLKKLNVGGPMFDMIQDRAIRVPGMYTHLQNKGKIRPL